MTASIQSLQATSLNYGQTITALFLGWQDPNSQRWLPIGKMTWSKDRQRYYFVYTQGMKESVAISDIQEMLLWGESERLYRVRESQGIDINFRSRFPSRPDDARTESQDLGLTSNPFDPILYMSRNGGTVENDHYDVFAEVEIDIDGNYHFYFVPLDLYDLATVDYQAVVKLPIAQVLTVRGGWLYDDNLKIGQLPGYLRNIVTDCPQAIQVSVAQINNHSPEFQCLLCHATVDAQLYTPFTTDRYQVLVTK